MRAGVCRRVAAKRQSARSVWMLGWGHVGAAPLERAGFSPCLGAKAATQVAVACPARQASYNHLGTSRNDGRHRGTALQQF